MTAQITETRWTDMSSLEVALALAERGVYVFPTDHPELPRSAGIGARHDPRSRDHQRGKHPCVPFTQKATTNPQEITAWFTGQPRNIGIYCGPSKLVVIDEDELGEFDRYADEHGVQIPSTFVVATAKGRHFYFEAREDHPLGNREGALGAYAINVRAGNGYVVGPGSVHETGVVYTVIADLPPAPLPDWVIEAIGTKKSCRHQWGVRAAWTCRW